MRFVTEWLEWVTASNYVTDEHDPARQHPGFQYHRHDQSILSLLLKKHLVKTFPLPAKEHDVRDIWGWDAGYCRSGFEWPLPEYRPNWYFGYILHYKEMGHQRESMRDCQRKQPLLAQLPLPDYLESHAELDALKLELKVADAGKRLKWSGGQFRRSVQQPVAAVEHVGGPPAQGQDLCVGNTTFGGFFYDGAPLLWIDRGCRGIFRCEGVTLRCGRPRSGFYVCACVAPNSLEASRHTFDGKLDPAARFLRASFRQAKNMARGGRGSVRRASD